MIFLACLDCQHALRISPGDIRGNLSEAEALFGLASEYYPDSYPCSFCGGKMQYMPAADKYAVQEFEVHDVNPKEALSALYSLGLPEEHDCGPTAVAQALTSSKVKSVGAHHIKDSHRCLLAWIDMEDGTRLYLGASAGGATVYRIAKPHKYVKDTEHA